MTSLAEGDLSYPSPEALAKLPQPQRIPLNGFSALFLSQNISKITFQGEQPKTFTLRPGIVGLVRHKNSYNHITTPNESNILTLIPRRDISKKSKTLNPSSNLVSWRFVLILYNPFKDQHKRKKASRLMQRTPLIRIKPGVILAPQIRLARFRPYQKILLRTSDFIQKLLELGTPVWYASRLEIYHTSTEPLIEQFLLSTIDKRIQRLIRACRKLFNDIRHSLKDSKALTDFKHRFIRIRKRVKYLRWQARFFKKEFSIDFQTKAARTSTAISRVYQQLKLCDT